MKLFLLILFLSNIVYSQCTRTCGVINTCPSSFVDARDSRTYAAVQIGSQCWMAENLNYGTYTAVATGGQNPAGTQKYCQTFDGLNDPTCAANGGKYGGLYEWSEMMDGVTLNNVNAMGLACDGTAPPPDANAKCASPVQGICPAGWHIPSAQEFLLLVATVGASDNLKLKNSIPGCGSPAPSCYWWTGSAGTDLYGFNMVSTGSSYAGAFSAPRYNAYLWSSTIVVTTFASARQFTYNLNNTSSSSVDIAAGYSVRCIKN